MVGEVAVQQVVISVGDLVPLPTFADGSQATESEIFWTAQLWRASFYPVRQLDVIGDASAMFSGRRLTASSLHWGIAPPTDVQVLVNVVAIRPHDNRKVNR